MLTEEQWDSGEDIALTEEELSVLEYRPRYMDNVVINETTSSAKYEV